MLFGGSGAAGLHGAPDTRGGRWTGGEPVLPDRLAAPDADAVCAVVEPADRGVDLRDLICGLGQQRSGVLALERERRALRVMLVVGARRARGLGDSCELAVQRGRPLLGTFARCQQQLTGVRHPSDCRFPKPMPVPWAIGDGEVPFGCYAPYGLDPDHAERLWVLSEKLTTH